MEKRIMYILKSLKNNNVMIRNLKEVFWHLV